VGFEPTISASGRQQTYALDRAATGTGQQVLILPANRYGKWPKHVAVIYFKKILQCTCEELMFIGPCIIVIADK